MPRIPLGDWVNSAVDWLLHHVSWLFDFLKTVFTGTYDGIDAVLQAPEPLLLAGIFAVLAFWLRGTLAGVLTFAGFAFIDSLELWDDAMVTLSLVLVATIIALLVSVPLGIWAARSDRVSSVVRPVLDFMQTLPAMIYLIPAILFFGTGASAGIVATLIFALAPGVRMTELGIRQVDAELVEAADAFGTTPRDTLLRVQLPLALPTVMAGVNQVIMLGLSMAAIAGMVGTGGLGGDVNEAIGQLDVGLGSEAGVAIVILAIYLDRMTGALGTHVSPLGRRAAARARSARGLKIWSYRPRSQVAMIGVVILALVAGGMGVFGGASGGSTAVADAKDVGQGKKVTLGYVPWDDGVASTFLWKEILQERGFQVDARQFDAGPLYTSVASGDVDLMTGAWLPTTHEQYWKKYGDRLDDLGAWYGKTSLELSVPSYMKGIDSLDDLKGKAARFGGKITGIESSAGETALLKSKVLKEYGLDKEYKVVDSSTPAMLAELKRAYSQKQPIVVTLWSPHWAYNDYQLTKLKDPKGAWGSGDGIHTVARKGFAGDNPVVGGWLKDFKLDERQLTSLEAEINKAGKGRQQDAVRAWLKKNPGVVDKLAPVRDSAAPAEAPAGRERRLVPLGRGHRRHLPVEERPAAARLQAEPQADGRRTRLHGTGLRGPRRQLRRLVAVCPEELLGQEQGQPDGPRHLVPAHLAGGRRALLRQGCEDLRGPQGQGGPLRREDHRDRAGDRRDEPAQDQGAARLRPGQGVQGRRRLHPRDAGRTQARLRQEAAGRRRALVAALGLQPLRPDQAPGRPETLRRGQHHPHRRQRDVPRAVPATHQVDQGIPYE